MKKLVRSKNSKIAGVCAGVADYFGWKVGFVRLLWLVLAFVGVGAPVLFYLILAFIMPAEGSSESYAERMEKKLKK
jgi:phage shock protein PspC (stress-responsive transcriptional regulator)